MHVLTGFLIITVLSVFACHYIVAKRKGDTVFWVVMAILIGPLAIPFAFFAKPKR
jgi:hypothetical protein